MPFGKYKGELISSLPTDYLEWLVENAELREPLKTQIHDVLDGVDEGVDIDSGIIQRLQKIEQRLAILEAMHRDE
jgi:hypothetical protein